MQLFRLLNAMNIPLQHYYSTFQLVKKHGNKNSIRLTLFTSLFSFSSSALKKEGFDEKERQASSTHSTDQLKK